MTRTTSPCVPPALFVSRRQVRWGECDPAGVVYTPRFSDYVVEAFLGFMNHLGPGHGAPDSEDGGFTMPAKAIEIVFMRSLWPEQWFETTVRVKDIRSRSFDLQIDAHDDEGQAVFRAVFSTVVCRYGERAARTIPSHVRELLAQYQARYPVPPPGPSA